MSLSKRYFELQAEREQPTARLERARDRIREVSRTITISEGRLLDYESAEDMQRALSAALRELQELTITLSVMERKVR